MSIHEMQEQALKLTDLEKIRLIEMLMDDLDRPSPQVEKLWIEESEKRYKAYKQGKVKDVCFEERQDLYSGLWKNKECQATGTRACPE